MNPKKKIKKKKRRLNYRKILLLIIFLGLLYITYNILISLKITNIYIMNNNYLSDQEIIEIAKISNYPSTFKNSSIIIKKRLTNNQYILDAKVYKKWFKKVYIKVKENNPLFYNQNISKTILNDKKATDKLYDVPTLLNIVPDEQYERLITEMRKINFDIITRISEIKYDPNFVDSDRFLLYMDDGNYVYLTLNKFDSINSYLEIIKNVEGKKGILYLDYGNNFTVIEE